MAERITKLQRWLDLIAYLVGRRYPVSVDQIMENVPAYAAKWCTEDETARATARRTFERDKDELRALGIPIETVRYHLSHIPEELEGYRLTQRDFYLPYLRLVHEASPSGERRPYVLDEVVLTEEEAQAAADALHVASQLPAFPFAREARSALGKLAFDLDAEALTATPELYVDRPGAEEILERLRPLSDALIARKVVRFRYHGIYRGEVTEREVRPYGLVFLRGNWYLIGHDVGRDAIRVFRVGRMENVEANRSKPHTPDYEIPSDFRLDDYLRREAWELGDEEPIRAEVLFRFPRSLWAERNGYGRKLEERPDGSAVRVFDVQQVNPFLRWILAMEGEAEVLSPPTLREELHTLAREVLALHGGGGEVMATPGVTAAEQLERVLYVISAASGKAGRSLAELAEALGVEPSQIARDLEEVTARAYYQRPGTVDAFQITNDGRRVQVWTTGEFRRPVRLSPLEALALGLGFRVLAAGAAGSEARREELLAFAQRLEHAVTAKRPEDLRQRFAADDGAPGDGSVRAVLRRAAAERRRCRIAYLASGTTRPDERVVCPYLLAYANGAWYVIAHCTKREAVRLFRLDRIVAAEAVEGTFEVPDDFDPSDYIAGGRIYRADEEIEAVVRYSPRIARWVRERGPVEELEDGSVAVRLRVADVHWLVRHVLQHGAEAEVVEPAELRLEVARAAERVLGREAG